MIYFDNAATTNKKPKEVINSFNYAIKYLSANPGRSGHNLSTKTMENVFETRNKICDFFNCDGPEQVIFTANCTESLNFVVKGVLKKGDHVVTTDIEHNAVVRPIFKTGVEHTVIETSFEDDSLNVQRIENSIKENTKLIIITSASNVFGKIMPLKEIGKIAKKHNILFAVDGAQGCGVIPIDMKDMNIDFLCVAPHKGLYSIMGTGILIARKNIDNTIIEGGTGTDSVNPMQPTLSPERFESGTLNVPGILSIGAGVDFVKKNIDNIYSNELAKIQHIYSELSKYENVIFYNTFPVINSFVPVLSFNIKGLNSQTTADLLNKNNIAVRAGLHCAPFAHKKMGTLKSGTVRIAPGFFTSGQETDFLIKIIKKIALNSEKYIE